MKSNATLFIFAAVAAAISLGISNSEAAESALDKEVRDAVVLKVLDRVTKCGDSYFGYPDQVPAGLHQYKNLTYDLEAHSLSSADKLTKWHRMDRKNCLCARG